MDERLWTAGGEMTPMKGVLLFVVLKFLFTSWLETRQLRELKKRTPPKELKHLVTKKEFSATRDYGLDKWYFGFLAATVDVAENIAFLAWGGLAYFWSLSGDLGAQYVPSFKWFDGEVRQAVVFTVIYGVTTTIMDQPFVLYDTFVIEQKHGFNSKTFKIYLADLMKSVTLLVVLAPPFVTSIVVILRNTGPYVALHLWVFLLAFNLFIMTIYPTVIAPLFNKYEPLSEGSLKTKIEALARRLDFPLQKLFVMDASTRSSHSNAYMYGFFKSKRIVIYDTLMNQCTTGEIVAILAHELGHWKLGHTPILFVSSMAVLLLQLTCYTYVSSWEGLFESFGFSGSKPAFIGMVLFSIVIGPVDVVIGFLSNVLSRVFEYQADRFAVGQGYAKQLTSGLIKLHKENKSDYNIDHLYSAFHFSHPSLIERIQHIDGLAAVAASKED